MSSLVVVITFARITSAEGGGDGSSAMEGGGGGASMVGWGGRDTKTVDRYLWEAGCKEHPKNHRPTIQTVLKI